jgi:hypothetical protein
VVIAIDRNSDDEGSCQWMSGPYVRQYCLRCGTKNMSRALVTPWLPLVIRGPVRTTCPIPEMAVSY